MFCITSVFFYIWFYIHFHVKKKIVKRFWAHGSEMSQCRVGAIFSIIRSAAPNLISAMGTQNYTKKMFCTFLSECSLPPLNKNGALELKKFFDKMYKKTHQIKTKFNLLIIQSWLLKLIFIHAKWRFILHRTYFMHILNQLKNLNFVY